KSPLCRGRNPQRLPCQNAVGALYCPPGCCKLLRLMKCRPWWHMKPHTCISSTTLCWVYCTDWYDRCAGFHLSPLSKLPYPSVWKRQLITRDELPPARRCYRVLQYES